MTSVPALRNWTERRMSGKGVFVWEERQHGRSFFYFIIPSGKGWRVHMGQNATSAFKEPEIDAVFRSPEDARRALKAQLDEVSDFIAAAVKKASRR